MFGVDGGFVDAKSREAKKMRSARSVLLYAKREDLSIEDYGPPI